MQIRPLAPEHAESLRAFFHRVPESDHSSFAEDVFEPGLLESWLRDERCRRFVAVEGQPVEGHVDGDVEGERVVGYVAVLPQVGWSSHVGSLRLVVDPAERGKGIGRSLARHGLLTGLELGLAKLVVEVVADAEPAIGMLQGLGFEPEALLRDHVRDKHGDLRDLVVLAHLVEGTWSGMATAGLEHELL
jgi:ribosomal protein S18 acetylase RimI-like enzyme